MARDGLEHAETPSCKVLAADVYDSPPESFLLSEEAKPDWLSSNAFFHRKGSAKSTDSNNNTVFGTAVSGSENLTPYSLRSNSHSADFKLRASSIIGLPKLRRPSKKGHRRNPSTCLFPSADRSTLVEPCSPKVTCIGRVRSRRGRNRVDQPEEPVRRTKMRKGWFVRLGSLFLSGCKEQQTGDVVARPATGYAGDVDSVAKRKQRGGNGSASELAMEVKPGPPSLAGMKRMASGKRSALWGNDLALPGWPSNGICWTGEKI